MEGIHRVSIANYREFATEEVARSSFRDFRPEFFKSGFDVFLSDPQTVSEKVDEFQRMGRYSVGLIRRLYDNFPDIHKLDSIFWGVDGDVMLNMYPELHRALIGKVDESVEQMTENRLGHNITIGGIHPKLQDALGMAFTPIQERSVYLEDKTSNSKRILSHFAAEMPDLSQLGTTEDRLDAVIRLLTFGIHDALSEVLETFGMSIDEFNRLQKTDPHRFSSIHREAGQLYAVNNIYGILVDLKNGGQSNLFRIRPDLGDEPQTTDTGRCPGESYARNFLEGLGQSLKENRETVLKVVKE